MSIKDYLIIIQTYILTGLLYFIYYSYCSYETECLDYGVGCLFDEPFLLCYQEFKLVFLIVLIYFWYSFIKYIIEGDKNE